MIELGTINPLSVVCSRCGAGVRIDCHSPGLRLAGTHRDRYIYAAERKHKALLEAKS